MRSSNNRVGLPWLLAEGLRALLFNLSASLHARTNLLALLHAITASIIDAGSTKLSERDLHTLADVQENLATLRAAYEPIMDSLESVGSTNKKRIEYEQLIDISIRTLMYIIHKYELVDSSYMGEIQAKTWDRTI